MLLESSWQVKFNIIYFTIFRASCNILVLSGCYGKKFKQIAKIWFGRKILLSSQCVHTWANNTGYTSYIGIKNLLKSYHILEINMGLMSHVILNIKISKHGSLLSF
jgi:hypothetical protein